MLLALFIQYSSPLECYFDVEEKPERNSTEQVHCVCGSYCSSMYYKFEKVYLRDCGCLVDENGTTLHICLKEGRNEFNGSDVDCCSRNLCNGSSEISRQYRVGQMNRFALDFWMSGA
ncbi:unnamed protein product, partial [Mesorhabditis belari]|uniref:Uncharacterized protein n=1 Tax=Mesorhabditis belari TaxID=2138241 RepID=A0AAF3FJF9_9BILA